MSNLVCNLQRELFQAIKTHSTIVRTAAIPVVILVFLTDFSWINGFVPNHSSIEAQLKGLNGWHTRPLFTVGDILPSLDPRFPHGYQPPGNLDGIGAFRLDPYTIRILINHEFLETKGYSYSLQNGTMLAGARISFVDLESDTQMIVNSGLAYTSVIDRQFQDVTHPNQINEINDAIIGFSKFCSGQLVGMSNHETNFVDPIYFAHEEHVHTHRRGGSLWGLDIQRHILHAIPAAGRLKFEILGIVHR